MGDVPFPDHSAHFRWQKSGNSLPPGTRIASVHKLSRVDESSSFLLVSCMGVTYFDREDAPHIAAQLRAAADKLDRVQEGETDD